MSNNLPPILPTSSNKPSPGGVSRAQSFSVGKLQQKKDREGAKVSVSQRIRSDDDREGPTTSVGRIGREENSTESLARSKGGMRSIYDDVERDKTLDRLRYQNIRKMIKERKEVEKVGADVGVGAKPEKVSPFRIPGVKTGGGFKTKGAYGLTRKFFSHSRQQRATFKNLSSKDRKYFLDMVGEHAKKVRRGTGFGRLVRKKMKRKVDRDWRAGKISIDDRNDFKKVINSLKDVK